MFLTQAYQGRLVPPPDRGPLPQRNLYLMAKPSVEPLGQVAGLSRLDRRRALELLHVSLLAFVNLSEWPPSFLPILLERMKDFDGQAFHVLFDRIVEAKGVTLRSSAPLHAARAFQKCVMEFLLERDFEYFGEPPEPHLTINYKRDGRGNEAIQPIGWCVDEVLLIESIYGRSTHIVHGRWALRRLLV